MSEFEGALRHPKEQFAYDRSMRLWAEAVSRPEDPRCARCWLRHRQCYCAAFDSRRSALACRFNGGDGLGAGELLLSCDVVMYYHYEEVGRSCNTGRVLEALAPRSCRSLVYGDEAKERQLLKELREEQDQGRPRTCVLYPHPGAPTLAEWARDRPPDCGPVRIIALDGTYPQAARQMKFLRRSLEGRPLSPGGPPEGSPDVDPGQYRLPLVRLDINTSPAPEGSVRGEQRGVTSALAGICNQPTGEKICTLQAVIMAINSCGESDALCDALTSELNDWIAYILRERIRLGKMKMKVIRDLSSFEPIPAVSDIMSSETRLMVQRQVQRESDRNNGGRETPSARRRRQRTVAEGAVASKSHESCAHESSS